MGEKGGQVRFTACSCTGRGPALCHLFFFLSLFDPQLVNIWRLPEGRWGIGCTGDGESENYHLLIFYEVNGFNIVLSNDIRPSGMEVSVNIVIAGSGL